MNYKLINTNLQVTGETKTKTANDSNFTKVEDNVYIPFVLITPIIKSTSLG